MSQSGIRYSGFSLLELVLVIFIISFLVAILVPKLNDLNDDAHTSAVRLTMTSFRAAVNLAHGLWESSGREGKGSVLKGYGEHNLIMSNAGWPVAVDNSARSTSKRKTPSATACVKLWNALLKDSAPLVSAREQAGIAYLAEYTNGRCQYRYRNSQDDLRIKYDLKSGRVELLSDSE